jgi:hypothetical protein
MVILFGRFSLLSSGRVDNFPGGSKKFRPFATDCETRLARHTLRFSQIP